MASLPALPSVYVLWPPFFFSFLLLPVYTTALRPLLVYPRSPLFRSRPETYGSLSPSLRRGKGGEDMSYRIVTEEGRTCRIVSVEDGKKKFQKKKNLVVGGISSLVNRDISVNARELSSLPRRRGVVVEEGSSLVGHHLPWTPGD
jgi:hypothetical protein